MIISIINQKGGVGKTTTAVNLGAALAEAGHGVLLVDLDPQLSLSSFEAGLAALPLELKKLVLSPRITITTARKSIAAFLCRNANSRSTKGRSTSDLPRDFTIIDCPPALGAATVAALHFSQLAIAPTPPRYLDIHGLAQLLDSVRAVRDGGNATLRYKVLITMRAHQTAHREFETQLQQAFAKSIFQTVIPRLKVFETATMVHQVALQYEPRGAAAAAYRALAREVMELRE